MHRFQCLSDTVNHVKIFDSTPNFDVSCTALIHLERRVRVKEAVAFNEDSLACYDVFSEPFNVCDFLNVIAFPDSYDKRSARCNFLEVFTAQVDILADFAEFFCLDLTN